MATTEQKVMHTPGPWKVADTQNATGSIGIGAADGSGYQIAQASCRFDDAERDANARLIAQAPKMLLLLKAVLACETHHDEQGHAYLRVPARSLADLGCAIHYAVIEAEGKE